MRRTLILLLLAGATLALVALAPAAWADVPAAKRYQREVTREARAVWGLNAPVAVFAGQIQQESGWRPDAKSPYAGGLAQFTPDTADWIDDAYPDLGEAQPFNPAWAIRALVRYDRHLYERNPGASECDRWAFTFSGYNGGQGHVVRDRKLAMMNGADPMRWWGAVERFSARADWAMRENRGYPRAILLRHQLTYKSWGPAVDCSAVATQPR